jgi:hypothetical protein
MTQRSTEQSESQCYQETITSIIIRRVIHSGKLLLENGFMEYVLSKQFNAD